MSVSVKINRMLLMAIPICVVLAGCSTDTSEFGQNADFLKQIGPCTFNYKSNKLYSFEKTELPYTSDSVFLYYETGKLSRVVKLTRDYDQYNYRVAYCSYQGSKIREMVVGFSNPYFYTGLNPDSVRQGKFGVDTSNRYYRFRFIYDSNDRLTQVTKQTWLGTGYPVNLEYSDVIDYSGASKNLLRVVRIQAGFGNDTLGISAYEDKDNPIYKFVPDFFYASMLGSYAYACQPIQDVTGSRLSNYLAISPNYLKSLSGCYYHPYGISCGVDLINKFDDKGNLKSSYAYVNLIQWGLGTIYSYN